MLYYKRDGEKISGTVRKLTGKLYVQFILEQYLRQEITSK